MVRTQHDKVDEVEKVWSGLGKSEGFNKLRLYWILRGQKIYGMDKFIIDEIIHDGFIKLVSGEINCSSEQSYFDRLNKFIRNKIGIYIKARGIVPHKSDRSQHYLGLDVNTSLDFILDNETHPMSMMDLNTPDEYLSFNDKVNKFIELEDDLCKKEDSPMCQIIRYMLNSNSYTDKDMANLLGLKVNTVVKYRQRIKYKFHEKLNSDNLSSFH